MMTNKTDTTDLNLVANEGHLNPRVPITYLPWCSMCQPIRYNRITKPAAVIHLTLTRLTDLFVYLTKNDSERFLLLLWLMEQTLSSSNEWSLRARFLGPTWGPSGTDRTQVGTMLAPWTLLPGIITCVCLQTIKLGVIWQQMSLVAGVSCVKLTWQTTLLSGMAPFTEIQLTALYHPFVTKGYFNREFFILCSNIIHHYLHDVSNRTPVYFDADTYAQTYP